jgi:hypothetical protein
MIQTAVLAEILQEIRRLVEVSGDFSWTSWIDREDALRELDRATEHLIHGSIAPLPILFAPTGPLQELSLSNGWGDAFVDLAHRYEVAIGCDCLSNPKIPVFLRDLGVDRRFGEVSIFACPLCGRLWLRYYYVMEAFTGSGRWYLGPIDHEVAVDEAQAKLESLAWYFFGGSYFDGKVGKRSGPLSF